MPNLPTTIETRAQLPADTFRISPLIWVTLWSLYLALIAPLPYLAWVTGADLPLSWFVLGLMAGGIALQAALSEQVRLDAEGIHVCYPRWVPSLFRQTWSLQWSMIQDIKARATGQGGRVFYLINSTETAYLLPMRVAGFARMTQRIEAETGLRMEHVKPLAQVWMYSILLFFTLLLGLADVWVFWTAMNI
ncbi:MAG: hypothetical protein AAF329_23335 [Cyanobacteria bacterium P01_A01_bin.17]